jgi:GT2 family glycosyltransferase
MRNLVAVLTCHNRKLQTLACLERFFSSQVQGVRLTAVLVDDGSSDGTGDAVARRFGGQVDLIQGDGQFFWNGGMRVAMSRAMAANPDFILWLNDDTMIQPATIAVMLHTHDERVRLGDSTAIVVAAFADLTNGQLTYSGMRRLGSRWRPLAFRRVEPGYEPLRCDTMNGNCVLLPQAAWQSVQNFEAGFIHVLGDFDYGLRATAMGIPIWLAPGVLGTCSRDSERGTFKDAGLPVTRRWRAITGTKGLPMLAWAIYTRRHAGVLWPVYWAWPYVKVLLAGIRKSGAVR